MSEARDDERVSKGSALVFVHGYLGGSAMWSEQVDRFSGEFQVFAPDLAGFGEAAGAKAPDRIESYAAQVLDHLSRHEVERFSLVGHSMGGMIAQQMAVMAPERIARLVLYGTGPRGVMPDRFEPIETSRQRMRRDGVAATARRIAATWFMDGADAAAYPLCADLGARVSIDTAIAGLNAMEAWDGRAALPSITMPTLVLWGDGDRSYAWPQPEALWRGIAGSRLAVVPGCAHNVHQEKPGLFNALIADFLTGPVSTDVSRPG